MSVLYGTGVRTRNRAFDLGWKKSHRARVPVISVGNITTGGTGKTPLVAFLTKWFQNQGVNVALLSRGYRTLDTEASGGRKPAGEVGASLTDTDDSALKNAANWLLDLQNRDGGFPTFCRGWGTLPFDRSSPDITAHSLRALVLWRGGMHARDALPADEKKSGERYRSHVAIWKAFDFLQKAQRPDGSWLPLWFGNQHAPDDINPTYGTAKVLAAYRDCNRIDTPEAQRGLEWLRANQNDDGGWGGVKGTPSSVEETSLAVEILLSVDPDCESAERGLCRLLDCVQAGAYGETAPIGFYFAKLWYFEKLYPLSLIVAALRRAVQLKRAGATTSTNTEAVRNTVSVATPD